MVTYDFNEWQFAEFERENGHMVIRVYVYVDDLNVSNVDMVLDTGAFVTVLSKETAIDAGLPLGTGKPVSLRGFSYEHDTIQGELIELPRIVVGKHFIYDVKVVIPLEDIEVVEVLGENVLEYMIYTVDHEKNVVYFKKNPSPKPYVNLEKNIDLSCGKVLLVNETEL